VKTQPKSKYHKLGGVIEELEDDDREEHAEVYTVSQKSFNL